jgi:hypothetical protein
MIGPYFLGENKMKTGFRYFRFVSVLTAGVIWLATGFYPAASATLTTVAGTGARGYNGEKIPAGQVMLTSPYSLTADSSGNIYSADIWENRIRKVDAATGLVTTVAGTGQTGYNGDGIQATQANLSAPLGVCVDPAGNLYFAEYSGSRVRKVDIKTGVISTVAGTGVDGYNGDGIQATSAQLNVPHGVAIDHLGRLYIADRSNSRCRRVDTHGIITTVAGGRSGPGNGDGGPATSARMGWVEGVWVSPDFDIYLAVSTDGDIRKVDGKTGTITTLTDKVIYPLGVVGDCGGHIFVGTPQPNKVFRVDVSTGETLALGQDGNFVQEDGNSRLADLDNPAGVALDNRGDLLIGDTDHNKILLVKGAAVPCNDLAAPDRGANLVNIPIGPGPTSTPGPIQVSPNPFSPIRAPGGVFMAYPVPAGSTMSIFNRAGELVAGGLPEVNLSPGETGTPQGVIAWTGLDSSGAKAPPGTYYFAIQNGGEILRAGPVKLYWK